jgi:hypothetical protein
MKPILYAILIMISVALALLIFNLPWAEGVFQIGNTEDQINLGISFWDKSLRVDGCMRGQAEGLDREIDIWRWVGKGMGVTQVCLWLVFLLSTAIRKGYRFVAVWSAFLMALYVILLMAFHPIIECLYIDFPPPLVFIGDWHISIISTTLAVFNLSLGTWMNISIRRTVSSTRLKDSDS